MFALVGQIALAGAHAAAGDTTAGALTVSDAWARASAGPVRSGVAYLTIVNSGDTDDRLVKVETPGAERAEVHTHMVDGDVMRMRPLEALDVAAGATVALEPGGLHLMLMGLGAPLEEGEKVPITLTFERAGGATVEATVMPVGAMSGPMHHEGH